MGFYIGSHKSEGAYIASHKIKGAYCGAHKVWPDYLGKMILVSAVKSFTRHSMLGFGEGFGSLTGDNLIKGVRILGIGEAFAVGGGYVAIELEGNLATDFWKELKINGFTFASASAKRSYKAASAGNPRGSTVWTFPPNFGLSVIGAAGTASTVLYMS